MFHAKINETSAEPAPSTVRPNFDQQDKPSKRFNIHLSNECDIYISARLDGTEPDFRSLVKDRLHKRHNGILDDLEIVRVILVG